MYILPAYAWIDSVSFLFRMLIRFAYTTILGSTKNACQFHYWFKSIAHLRIYNTPLVFLIGYRGGTEQHVGRIIQLLHKNVLFPKRLLLLNVERILHTEKMLCWIQLEAPFPLYILLGFFPIFCEAVEKCWVESLFLLNTLFSCDTIRLLVRSL